jgi:hypothetical protein
LEKNQIKINYVTRLTINQILSDRIGGKKKKIKKTNANTIDKKTKRQSIGLGKPRGGGPPLKT